MFSSQDLLNNFNKQNNVPLPSPFPLFPSSLFRVPKLNQCSTVLPMNFMFPPLNKFGIKLQFIWCEIGCYSGRWRGKYHGDEETGTPPALNLGKKSPNLDSIPAKMGKANW